MIGGPKGGLPHSIESLTLLLSGIVLGFSVAAPPGPINAFAADQIVTRRSWLAGWLVMLGATTADAIFFGLTYFGLTALATPLFRRTLFFAGGCLMLYFAFSILRRARSVQDVPQRRLQGPENQRTGRPRVPSSYLVGLSMGLTNPYQLGWWLTVGTGMVTGLGVSVLIGFFAGIIAWTLMFSTLVSRGLSRYRELYRFIAYASGLLLAVFGLWFLAQAFLSSFEFSVFLLPLSLPP